MKLHVHPACPKDLFSLMTNKDKLLKTDTRKAPKT